MKRLLFFLCMISFSRIFGMQFQPIAKPQIHLFDFMRLQNQTDTGNYIPLANFDQFNKEYHQLCEEIIRALNMCEDSDNLKTHLEKLITHYRNFGIKPSKNIEIKGTSEIAFVNAKEKSIKDSRAYAKECFLKPSNPAGAFYNLSRSQDAYYNAYINKSYVEVFGKILQQSQTAAPSAYIFDFERLPNNVQASELNQFVQEYKRLNTMIIVGLGNYAKPNHIESQLDDLRTLCSNYNVEPRNIKIKAAAAIILDNITEQYNRSKKSQQKFENFMQVATANRDHVEAFDTEMNK